MNIKIFGLAAIILLAFLASFSWPAASGQLPSMTDLTVAAVQEEYGKWMVEFNWSDMDEYDRSVAHGDSTSGKTAVHTDTLTLASSLDRSKAIKVSVITYSQSDPSHVNMNSMTAMANNTLASLDVCQDINIVERLIEGRTGISASGLKCRTGKMVYAAVYPVLYHLDRPDGVLPSDAMGLILSTYDREVTERFVNSIKITQIK
ncbi:MAG: hypothetical protein LUQ44_05340 [Methanothrix sp.]|nr:hypothetical protein [Methanothrix sp.]